jgi:tetratricopeptide (TPR) repeat protein
MHSLRLPAFSFALLLALSLAACAGAYGEFVGRGDKFAEAGLWDKAATEYEAAAKLDPQKPEAQIKLKDAKRRQSGERLAKGRALLARGELAVGLAAIQDAASLDPDGVEAQKALSDANAAVLAKARELLDAGEGKKAFELTTLVLKGSPNDPRAKELDGRVRDKLASEAYERAERFLKKGKTGNGLMELAAASSVRPGYRDTKLRMGQVKLDLMHELMFFVVLDHFGGTGSASDLASTLTPDLVGQTFDDKLPLRVVAQVPSKDVGPHLRLRLRDGHQTEPRVRRRGARCRAGRAATLLGGRLGGACTVRCRPSAEKPRFGAKRRGLSAARRRRRAKRSRQLPRSSEPDQHEQQRLQLRRQPRQVDAELARECPREGLDAAE